MKASIVVGLGFGDEGKGITTDYLCSQSSEEPIVIRFSGGQQAGHTVMLDGKKHVHSNFASGALRGLTSYFTEHCCIYLNTIMEERRVLREKGIEPRLVVHPFAKLTTPYDVAFNRVMEKRLGHGSCGLGIAATFKRHNETGYKLFAMELSNHRMMYAKMEKIREYYINLVGSFMKSQGLGPLVNSNLLAEFNSEAEKQLPDFEKAVLAYLCSDMGINPKPSIEIEDYRFLTGYKELIFEGSQGIWLDMDHGVFPNVTYANTTSKNAFDVLNKAFPRYNHNSVELFYVTRTYLTRHGAGWMPMSAASIPRIVNNEEEINRYNQWQNDFRIQELDYGLLNNALWTDSQYADPFVKKNLVVTCVDQRPGVEFGLHRLTTKFNKVIGSHSPYSKDMVVST